jgi:hypothetical protein
MAEPKELACNPWSARLLPEAVLATTQFSDILSLNGQKHSLDSLPLEQY